MDKNEKIIKILREEYNNIFSIIKVISSLKIMYKLYTLILILAVFVSARTFIFSEDTKTILISYLSFSVMILLGIKFLNIVVKENKKKLFNDSKISDKNSYIRKLENNKTLDMKSILKAHKIMKIKDNYKSSTKLIKYIGIAINSILIPVYLTIILKYNFLPDIKLLFYTAFFCTLIPIIISSADGILYNRQKFKDHKIIFYLDLYKANQE